MVLFLVNELFFLIGQLHHICQALICSFLQNDAKQIHK